MVLPFLVLEANFSSIGLRHWQTSGTEFNQFAPLTGQNVKRLASLNEKVRGRLGQPLRRQYGQSQVEALDIYHTNCTNVPVFVFIHGGAWPAGLAKNNASQQSCSSMQAPTTSLSILSPLGHLRAIWARIIPPPL